MPCNLATSITRCAVQENHLRQLLNANIEQVATLVQKHLNQHETYGKLSPRVTRQNTLIRISLGGHTWLITIRNGQIQISDVPLREQRQAEQLSQELTELLTIITDEFFIAQVREFVGDALIHEEEVEVDNLGQRQIATVLKVKL